MHPKYNEIIEKLQSINDAKPDPDRQKNLEKRLIESWINSNFEELENKLFSQEQLQKMWDYEWEDVLTNLDYEYNFEEVDEEEFDDAVRELEMEGPGELDTHLMIFDSRFVYFDVQRAVRTYCNAKNIDYTSENLERVMPKLTIEYVEDATNFETTIEDIVEDIRERANDDVLYRLGDMLGI
jgi:hypothetical protein